MSLTNKERIEENNIKLQDLKTKIDNLPEYQDVEPIYGGLDYTSKTYSVEDISGDFINPTFYVFGKLCIRYSRNKELFIYYDGEYINTFIGKTNLDKKIGVIYYNQNEYIFIVNNMSTYTDDWQIVSVNIKNKTITDLGRYTLPESSSTIYTSGKEFILGASNNLYRYNKETNTFKKYGQFKSSTQLNFIGNNFYICYHVNHAGYINKFIYNSESDTYSITSKQIDEVNGINYYGNKIFISGNVYKLNNDLSVGDLLAKNVYDGADKGYTFYCINDKYFIYNGMLYSWDDETNTMTKLIKMYNGIIGGYLSDNNTHSVVQYDFTKSQTQIGVSIKGTPIYFNWKPEASTSDDLLSGKVLYTSGADSLTGTMPNNGELNYTPSTEDQTIPKGYTSGGTISKVSITEEDYNECLKITKQILGGTENE